ncbi:MAG: L-threonine 3-dehydrogenase [Firmicutes bacterium]|jgi:threonine 3-dehydrogenase|nr:L-threonine 3-dehydrogenase [Bacillota bacterium]
MSKTMKAIAKLEAAPGFNLIEAPIPRPKAGEVLVRVRVSAICGTDVHIYAWDQWSQNRIKPPLIFGHEFCGDVVEIGEGVKGVKEGDFVSVETHFTCGVCQFCRTGRGHICQDVKIVGVDRDGCFAEYVTVPYENLWVWDYNVDPEVAAIQDPYGNAVHTALACNLVGAEVLITGVGPIGLAAIPIAKMAGAKRVICSDVSSYRLDLAKKFGADVVIDVHSQDLYSEVVNVTKGAGVDVLLEMSGNETAINDAFKCLANGGTASLLGIPSKPITIDLATAVVFKGATVFGINGRKMYETWYQGQALLERGLDLTPLITHRLPLERIGEGFELMQAGQCGKIIIYPDGSEL